MGDPKALTTTRRDLFGLALLALFAGLMITVAVVIGGGVDD